MTYQEILEGITRHRANPINTSWDTNEIIRKTDEIEWALQALAERGVEIEQMLVSSVDAANQAIIDDLRRQAADAKKT